VNGKKSEIIVSILLSFLLLQPVWAESIQGSVNQGNRLYAKGNFNEAINKYDQALIENPQVSEPKFNKANSFYRLDDLAKAMDLYREVAAESKDMKLVAKARYNLGNCHFQQGLKQRDSNLEKALEGLKDSIVHWRQVLDIEPENEKAAKNIEVARLIIKDIIDQLNKQKQQDPNQPRDPNQPQQQQQTSHQDPNQVGPQQQQQVQDPNGPEDPNEAQQPQEQKAYAPDATAQEILDKEQREKKIRQTWRRGGYEKVEMDW